MKVFNKTYSAKELPQRRANIVKSIVDIVKCIIDSFLGKIVIQHTLGLNPLSDLNESEFKALLGTKPGAPRNQTIDVSETVSVRRKRSDIFDAVCQPKSSSPLPASFDWRTSYSKNFVTSVKDQKQCGDCWAFATSATIESQYLIKTGQSANTTDCDLSEQDLLNCASSDGCNGETIDAAMNEVINNGQAREAAAPYLGMVDPNGCHHYPIVNGLIISDYCSKGGVWTTTYSNGTVVQWTEDNPDSKIIRDLIDWGPIVFLLNADQIQGYKSGIFSSNNCSTDINHAVTLVGYGTSSGIDYWIIKNSWGPLWGEGGYFRMRRGNLNMCGSNYLYYYPIMTSTAPYNHS